MVPLTAVLVPEQPVSHAWPATGDAGRTMDGGKQVSEVRLVTLNGPTGHSCQNRPAVCTTSAPCQQ